MSTLPVASTAEFIAACHQHAVTTAIVAWRSEWGPAIDGSRDGEYRMREECRLIAYANGVVIGCDLDDTKRDEVEAQLTAAGLSVEQRNRNLTAFNANRRTPPSSV